MKRVILVATVVAVVITLLVFPASAAETTVYVGYYEELEECCYMYDVPPPGDYSLYFSVVDFSGNDFAIDVPLVNVVHVPVGNPSRAQAVFSCFIPFAGDQELVYHLYFNNKVVDIFNDDYCFARINEVRLTPIAAAAPDPGTGSDVRTFAGSVTSGLKSVISWIGSILDSLLHGGLHDLLSLMGVAIAITALLLIAKLIRHFTWGV